MTMLISSAIAKCDGIIRPFLTRARPETSARVYSAARQYFIRLHERDLPKNDVKVSPDLERVLWGIRFRSPLFNAAGIYKNGAGYAWCAMSGAGAYLAGTTTNSVRKGNKRNGVCLPFMPYPQSRAASNWLGLPNIGHSATAKILASTPRVSGCPIGVSVAFDPIASGEEAFAGLINGLNLYQSAGVDFIELNESCPNAETHLGIATQDALANLFLRLDELSRRFLRKRKRNFPVIIKFSNDTNPQIVPILLDALSTMGYDGVNFGNTSTDYAYCKTAIVASERKGYDYFTRTFGGGISGKPLAERSLALTRKAAETLSAKPPRNEFHIIRTGGVESASDASESLKAGAALIEWFTGYFENYSKYGERIYDKIYKDIRSA